MLINEVTAGKIMVPGAQLLNRLVSALRRQPEPTVSLTNEEVDVFDRMGAQLEAIHELRVWRAVRNMPPELLNCPSRPRLIRHLLSAEEEKHLKACTECQLVLKKANISPLTLWFEKVEQRWQRFKETTSSFQVRLVQGGVLMILVATLLTIVSYPMRSDTERLLNDLKTEMERSNEYAEEVSALQHDRDSLTDNLTQLHGLISTLDKRSKESQAKQRELVRRLSLVTKELNALKHKHQELINPVARESSIQGRSDRSSFLQARGVNRCGGCKSEQKK